jgi:hypothetical protein
MLGLIVSLILVGLVSGTPIRHVIQISPCVLSLILLWRRDKWGRISAVPLFAFWFVLMTLIWLFLLGIAKVISGHFTPVEIALTISIAICCLAGFRSALHGISARPFARALGILAAFLILQIGALWVSMQPQFARI